MTLRCITPYTLEAGNPNSSAMSAPARARSGRNDFKTATSVADGRRILDLATLARLCLSRNSCPGADRQGRGFASPLLGHHWRALIAEIFRAYDLAYNWSRRPPLERTGDAA